MLFIANWKTVLKKSLVVWVAVLGALLPDLPDLILRFIENDASSHLLSPEAKNYIRMAIMFFVIPLVRIYRQQALHPGDGDILDATQEAHEEKAKAEVKAEEAKK